MNKITVNFPVDKWVWLCEFLSEVIHQGELNEYEEKDTEALLELLESAERGI